MSTEQTDGAYGGAYGYGPLPTKEARKAASLAKAWRYDPTMEQVEQMRTSDPAGYAQLSPQTVMSLGYYQAARATAKAAGIDTSGGDQ